MNVSRITYEKNNKDITDMGICIIMNDTGLSLFYMCSVLYRHVYVLNCVYHITCSYVLESLNKNLKYRWNSAIVVSQICTDTSSIELNFLFKCDINTTLIINVMF